MQNKMAPEMEAGCLQGCRAFRSMQILHVLRMLCVEV